LAAFNKAGLLFTEYAQCAAHRNKQTMNNKNSEMSLISDIVKTLQLNSLVQNMTIQYP